MDKILTLSEMKINGHGFIKMCRLCLKHDVLMKDIFSFKEKRQVVNKIIECTSVMVTRTDEMPNFICRLCYSQLVVTHRFQKQVLKSDEILKDYLQLLRSSKTESFIQQISSYQNSESSKNLGITPLEIKEELQEINMEFQVPKISVGNIKHQNSQFSKNHITQLEIKEELQDINMEFQLPKISVNNIKQETDVEPNSVYLETVWFNDEPQKEECEQIIIKEETLPIWQKSVDSEAYQNASVIHSAFSGVVDTLETHDVNKMRPGSNLLSDYNYDISMDRSNLGQNDFNTNYNLCINAGESQTSLYNRTERILTPNSSELTVEKQLHSFQCNVCNKCYVDKSTLTKHKLIHTGDRPFRCNVCDQNFSRSFVLKRHMLKHSNEKPYHCDICNKGFIQLGNFEYHKLKHTCGKPFQCDVCDKCFTRMFDLKVHKLLHMGEKPYKCNLCANSYTEASELHRHKLVHTGETSYKCDVCDKVFKRSYVLKRHKLSHTGERPYQCDICSKSFAEMYTLKNHRLRHTGEKPFQCDVCNKGFIQSGNLEYHKLKHTGEKPFRCHICPKAFSSTSDLNRHKKIHAISFINSTDLNSKKPLGNQLSPETSKFRAVP